MVPNCQRPILGDWSSDDANGIVITPGYNCDIRSVQSGRPVNLVEMRCRGEGPERPQLVREIWALRKVDNNDILVIADVGGAAFPSIHLLWRPKP